MSKKMVEIAKDSWVDPGAVSGVEIADGGIVYVYAGFTRWKSAYKLKDTLERLGLEIESS